MKREVIHIYGASGSGTSTLGSYICSQTGFFFMDTDGYYWEATDPPFTTKRSIPDRIKGMKRDIEAHQQVVISGSLSGWGDELIPSFTLAVRIQMDTALRLERLKKRESERFGKRIEPGGDMYEAHQVFLKWAAQYDEGGTDMRSRLRHQLWEQTLLCPVLLIDGTLSLEKKWEIIQKAGIHR